jgi:SAM-dependent methyltransferase
VLSPEELKELNRTMWSLGEYARVAELLEDGARILIDQLAIYSGQRHLDVATGNGNVALLSAKRGAHVTGLDLTSQYFDEARARARHAGVDIDFIEGDAEHLPFPDDSFDLVTSTYGVQFAPRHEYAAAEMARVCRPGGLIGLCNWTASGWTGRFQDIIASYFPPLPSYARSPMLWGDEQYVRELFGDRFEVWAQRRRLVYCFPSADALVSFFESCFGPCIIAKRAISPRRRWQELRRDLVAMTEEFWLHDSGEARVEPEYLLVLARKRDCA